MKLFKGWDVELFGGARGGVCSVVVLLRWMNKVMRETRCKEEDGDED